MIDKLLENNLGYLVYQEDTIAFLQNVCGLSGSEADNIRRAIGRKQKDRLDKAMPSILEGYCSKSDKPREQAEAEAKEFLQVIEDSASYQFGYNHSIAYCLLGYLCAYFRHYYPIEFITSFLNNASNDDDIKNGTIFAAVKGIKVTMPKWGFSRSYYSYDKERKIIAKGILSIKYMSKGIAEKLYKLAHNNKYEYFVDVLYDIENQKALKSNQLSILINVDFFSEFGNQRELLRINDFFSGIMKKGEAKQIRIDVVDGLKEGSIIQKYSSCVGKDGKELKSYRVIDAHSILTEFETAIKNADIKDVDDITKIRNFKDAMGYVGYYTGKEEDRKKLYVIEVRKLFRKKDGRHFGYSIITKSVGSGKESRLTVFNRVYDKDPIKEDEIIYCDGYEREEGGFFTLTAFHKIQ